MISSKTSRYQCELNRITDYTKVSFPLRLEVIDNHVGPALTKIHSSFNRLTNTVHSFGIGGVDVTIVDPEQSLQKARFIQIEREESLKVKSRISIDIIVEANFSNLSGFWNKTKALGEIIDLLDTFCDAEAKEKGSSAYLDRSKITEYQTEPNSPKPSEEPSPFTAK